ncbi:MAG TPA: c-type cytochrome [Steroidobacteraceae bacterium]|nr:c-type cytochrome [Steroidobacteraceae bacterium]
MPPKGVTAAIRAVLVCVLLASGSADVLAQPPHGVQVPPSPDAQTPSTAQVLPPGPGAQTLSPSTAQALPPGAGTQTPSPSTAQALPPGLGAQTPSTAAPGPPRSAQAVREFLGLGPAPDGEAAKRGAPVYAANCSFCHGPQARGAEGPSLIYSELVLKDQHGTLIADFLRAGRPEKGMPAFATLTDEQRKDVAEFLHQQVEDVANRGTFQIKNIVLGNPKKGARYVAAHCLGCHSLTGDLRGLAEKWRPADLQHNWIMPPRTGDRRAITATVHAPQATWHGRVEQIDDFRVVLLEGSGQFVVVVRDAGVTVELHDPLAPHVAMIGNLADSDMINVTAYLETLQ